MKVFLVGVTCAVGMTLTACGDGTSGVQNAPPTPAFTRLTHIVHMGQSLGSGDDAFPVLTVADTGYGNFQFSRGVHTWRAQEPAFAQAPAARPDSDFNLVPIIAGEPATGTGETIASGLVDQLKMSIGNAETRFIFSFAGQGTKRLRQLDKQHDDAKDPRSIRQTAGGYYITSIDDVRRAKSQAAARNWTYSVGAITWMQGEENNDLRINDWSAPLDRASFLDTYANDLIALKNDWNTDIQAITGQKARIPLFTYQTWGAISGQAQLLASDRDPEIIVVSPTYYMTSAINSVNPLSGAWGNWVHLSGDSERWLGAQFAKVIKRAKLDGETWKPVRPLKAWASDDRKTVYVKYSVPRPPLVIDTTFLPAAPGAGLFIRGGPDVTKVDVTAPDTLALTLSSSLSRSGSFFVEYASENGTSVALKVPAPVLSVKPAATWPNGKAGYEVAFAGDFIDQLSTIRRNGVFILQSDPNAPGFASGTIRSVTLDSSGNTVLKGEVGELRNGVNFAVGQMTTLNAIVPFGNVRDSDPEISIYKFANGSRAGQPYPLWNWSVGFEELPISNSP